MACASPLRILALRSSHACQDVQQWLSLKLTIASPPPQAVLSFIFALRLQHALSHCASLELTPTLHQVPSHCSHHGACALPLSQAPLHCASLHLTLAFILLTPMHLHTALSTSTFTLCFTTIYLRIDITTSPHHCFSPQLLFTWPR